ncbi:hypothetical protein SNUCP5_15940 [Clostridium perfringens A]|uniref:hypothetical protein n=1 Tax=Clostridium perfringens TaxID=1502 RepID=UPI00399CA659
MSTKTLYFYKLSIKPTPLFANIDNLDIKSCLNKALNVDFTIDNGQTIIDVLEFKNDYIFGSIGKLTDLNDQNKALIRKRDIKNKSIINKDDKVPFYLEDFTYFLIGGKDLSDIIVLKNSKAPNIEKPLKTRILEVCPEVKVNIFAKQVENLTKSLKRLKKLCEISFVTNSEETKKGIRLSIKGIKNLSETKAEKISVSMTYQKDTITPELLEEITNNTYEGFVRFDVTGHTSDDSETQEIVDMVKKVVTKRVSIPISEDTLKDNNRIKSLLLHELSCSQ